MLEHVHPVSRAGPAGGAERSAAYGVKGPLVYTSVGVKNWTAWQKLGISNVNAPTMFHTGVALTEAVSLGDLQHAQTRTNRSRCI